MRLEVGVGDDLSPLLVAADTGKGPPCNSWLTVVPAKLN